MFDGLAVGAARCMAEVDATFGKGAQGFPENLRMVCGGVFEIGRWCDGGGDTCGRGLERAVWRWHTRGS